MEISISKDVKHVIPSFKLGLITYHDITVTETPQLLQGRFQLLLEEWLLKRDDQPISEIPGIKEWRSLFKVVGTDPSRYRPSHEALIRRLKKDRFIPSIHTAADVNNTFSILYEMPMGIYDLDHLSGPFSIMIGDSTDSYEGLNGREVSMEKKLCTEDQAGPFGSPIVDSKRSMVTEATKNAMHLLYFRPSLSLENCQKIMEKITHTFIHFNGGEAQWEIIE